MVFDVLSTILLLRDGDRKSTTFQCIIPVLELRKQPESHSHNVSPMRVLRGAVDVLHSLNLESNSLGPADCQRRQPAGGNPCRHVHCYVAVTYCRRVVLILIALEDLLPASVPPSVAHCQLRVGHYWILTNPCTRLHRQGRRSLYGLWPSRNCSTMTMVRSSLSSTGLSQ